MHDIKLHRWSRIPDYMDATEMQTGQLRFDDDACLRCDICGFICPARSILRDSGPAAWRKGLPYLRLAASGITNCVSCGCCAAACPNDAIQIARGFNPGYFFQRLSQSSDLAPPRFYPPAEDSGNAAGRQQSIPSEDCVGIAKKDRKTRLRQGARKLQLLGKAGSAAFRLLREEAGRIGWRPALAALRSGNIVDMSWSDLLEERSSRMPDKPCLLYGDERYTYRQMNARANQAAHFLMSLGGMRGRGLGIFMRNSPRFLDLFFGAQKIGMYIVPINPEARGDGLAYVIRHSDIDILALDAELLTYLDAAATAVEPLAHIIVNDVESEASGIALPETAQLLSRAYSEMPDANPGVGAEKSGMCMIMYTSGTTGPPKGVVYRYGRTNVKRISFLAYLLLRESDVYYTALALCHGNALLMTVTMSMAVGGTIVLARKFSASRFWSDIRQYDVTVFNTIGSIIPILLKQPENVLDRRNKVRFVLSAACPADMWERFEQRFGIRIYEGYGAVDGGGKGIMNLGTAPVGSLGKPSGGFGRDIRLLDENGRDVPDGMPGELVFKMENRASGVEYYKNESASNDKVRDGWLYTGDLVRRDKAGFLYFVGRNTESMRKGGENVSAYEVEHVIMQHPGVEEAAVFAVPSELAEDEIMAVIKPVDGHKIDPPELRAFLSGKLARYAVPRYIRLVTDLPKTNSHRVIKKQLETEGVTADTFDAQQPA